MASELSELEKKSYANDGLSDAEDLAKLFSDLGDEELRAALEIAKKESQTEANQSPPPSEEGVQKETQQPTEGKGLGITEEAKGEKQEKTEKSEKQEKPEKEEVFRSYEDLKKEFEKQKSELEELKKLLLLQTNLQNQTAQIPERRAETISIPELESLEDTEILEKPKETLLKILPKVADAVAAKRILEYHDWLSRQAAIESFRASHPDFDELREDLIALAKSRPDLDKMHPAQALPILYEMAKAKRNLTKSESKEKPKEETKESKETKAEISPDLLTNLKKEVLRQLMDEMKKRKAASSVMEAPPATNPQERIEGKPQLSPEEEIFLRMLKAGPKNLDLDSLKK